MFAYAALAISIITMIDLAFGKWSVDGILVNLAGCVALVAIQIICESHYDARGHS